MRSGGITPVMTFHEASGLSVWCGRGFLSGKKRDLRAVGDEARPRDSDGEGRGSGVEIDEVRRPPSAEVVVSGEVEKVSVKAWVVSLSFSGGSLVAVRRSNKGKPEVAPIALSAYK